MRFNWRMLAVTVTMGSSHVLAQNAPAANAVSPGDRVRVTMIDLGSPERSPSRTMVLRGTVLSAPGDSLTIRYAGSAQLTVPRAAVADLAVSRGTRPGWRAHPVMVALGSALVVSQAAIAIRASHLRRDDHSAVANRLVQSSITFGALEAIITGKMAFSRAEQWERVPR